MVPTAPVLASAIVTGEAARENIPARLRRLLSAESGANDGLAYPLVVLPVLLLAHPPVRRWEPGCCGHFQHWYNTARLRSALGYAYPWDKLVASAKSLFAA